MVCVNLDIVKTIRQERVVLTTRRIKQTASMPVRLQPTKKFLGVEHLFSPHLAGWLLLLGDKMLALTHKYGERGSCSRVGGAGLSQSSVRSRDRAVVLEVIPGAVCRTDYGSSSGEEVGD